VKCETNPISSGFAEGRPLGSQKCKTNPIWLVDCRLGGRNVRNEPNFRPPRYPTIPIFQRSSPMPIVRNEPNSAQPRRGQVTGRGKMRNEPNCSGRPGPGRTRCAKRSQFGVAFPVIRSQFAPRAQEWARAAGIRNRLCKTNPIPGVPPVESPILPVFYHSNGMPIVRNEPNFGRSLKAIVQNEPNFRAEPQLAGGPDSDKQSQFPAGPQAGGRIGSHKSGPSAILRIGLTPRRRYSIRLSDLRKE
jgi:hypothetical protein